MAPYTGCITLDCNQTHGIDDWTAIPQAVGFSDLRGGFHAKSGAIKGFGYHHIRQRLRAVLLELRRPGRQLHFDAFLDGSNRRRGRDQSGLGKRGLDRL